MSPTSVSGQRERGDFESVLTEVHYPLVGTGCLLYAPDAPFGKERASQEPWLRECGGLGLMPAEQIWRDLRLLVNKAQIEASSADGSQGWGGGGLSHGRWGCKKAAS